MSETTNKMRDVAIYSDSLIRVRDLTADAIEAVEAQVAEAAARVAALEKRPTIVSAGSQDDDRVKPAPVRRFKVGDRIRFVAEPKWVKGYLGALGTIKRLKGDASLDYYIASDVSGTNGDHVSANDADLEPAPSAVPAPRGFRVGDKVRHRDYPDEVWTVRHSPNVHELVICDTPRPERWGAELAYHAVDDFLTLVRAADAPEAPAEDAGLVERLAEVWIKSVDPKLSWPTGASDPIAVRRGTRGILAAMTAESIRCAPGEVARLTAERDEARAISAATAERVRNEKQIATELRKDLADANDRLTSQSRSIEEMHAEMVDLRAKLAATEKALDVERRTGYLVDGTIRVHTSRADRDFYAETHWVPLVRELPRVRAELAKAEAERDALRADLAALKAKPRSRTRKVTAKDVGAWEEEWCKDSYGAGERHKAMNALGFRRRVDGAK